MRGFRINSCPRAYYHQQYLAKNPDGYWIGGCGVPYRTAGLKAEGKA